MQVGKNQLSKETQQTGTWQHRGNLQNEDSTERYCRISVVVKIEFYFIIITEPLKQEIFGSQRACVT